MNLLAKAYIHTSLDISGLLKKGRITGRTCYRSEKNFGFLPTIERLLCLALFQAVDDKFTLVPTFKEEINVA